MNHLRILLKFRIKFIHQAWDGVRESAFLIPSQVVLSCSSGDHFLCGKVVGDIRSRIKSPGFPIRAYGSLQRNLCTAESKSRRSRLSG